MSICKTFVISMLGILVVTFGWILYTGVADSNRDTTFTTGYMR